MCGAIHAYVNAPRCEALLVLDAHVVCLGLKEVQSQICQLHLLQNEEENSDEHLVQHFRVTALISCH